MGFTIIPNQPVNLIPYTADDCNIGDGKEYCMLHRTGEDLYLQIAQEPCDLGKLCEPEFVAETPFALTNGGFTGDASGWTLTNMAYGAGDIYRNLVGAPSANQAGLSFVSGKTYRVLVHYTDRSIGSLDVEIGSGAGYIVQDLSTGVSSGTFSCSITLATNETEITVSSIQTNYDGRITLVEVFEGNSCWTYDASWSPSECGLSHVAGSTTSVDQVFFSTSGTIRLTITVSGMTSGTLYYLLFGVGYILEITQNGTYQYNYNGSANTDYDIRIQPSTDFDGCISDVQAYNIQGTILGAFQLRDVNGVWNDVITDFSSYKTFHTDDGRISITIPAAELVTEGCYRFGILDQCREEQNIAEQMSPDVFLNTQALWTNYNIANSSILVTGGVFEQIILANSTLTSSYIVADYTFPYTGAGYVEIDWEIRTDSQFDSDNVYFTFTTPALIGTSSVYLDLLIPSTQTTYRGTVLIPLDNSGVNADKFGFGVDVDSSNSVAADENHISSASFIIRNYYPSGSFAYVSNTICISDDHACTKEIIGEFGQGADYTYQLGFGFATATFKLKQYLRTLKFNPAYPIEASDYEYSSGSRNLITAKREKYYEALFDYMGETELDTLTAQILCEEFTIDGVQYFVKPEDVKPEWNQNGSQRLAQVRMLMRKTEGTIYKNNP